jgi:hypothetical protein
MKENKITPIENQINNRILTIRNKQVMLDSDLAKLYGVETKRLNEQVKRNSERFPNDFCWQLTKKEYEFLRSQFATLETKGRGKYKKYLSYVFTEHGVAMLSSVLKSKVAIQINIQIINAFIKSRKIIKNNLVFISRLENLEEKQIKDKIEVDQKFEKVFKALETKKPEFGLFYENKMFDAYKFIADLVKSAQKRLILIDNFVDENTFYFLKNINKKIEITIYTKNLTKELTLIKNKFNSQYKDNVKLKEFKLSHDRFLIIDNDLYHLGASLKDLGKKWFGFSKMNDFLNEVLERLREIK